jgi:hypothetical protein
MMNYPTILYHHVVPRNYFELSASGEVTSTIKYYYAGSDRVAMRKDGGAVMWLLGDHLGRASLVYDGSETIRQGYKAWGEKRNSSNHSKPLAGYNKTGFNLLAKSIPAIACMRPILRGVNHD